MHLLQLAEVMHAPENGIGQVEEKDSAGLEEEMVSGGGEAE